jgi:hypothetical protein
MELTNSVSIYEVSSDMAGHFSESVIFLYGVALFLTLVELTCCLWSICHYYLTYIRWVP